MLGIFVLDFVKMLQVHKIKLVLSYGVKKS